MDKIIITNRDKNLLDSLREDFNIPLDASCSGNGTCGKCKVKILNGNAIEPESLEKSLLTDYELDSGIRLACNVMPITDIELEVEYNVNSSLILESHLGYTGKIDTLVKRKDIKLSRPSLEDQRDDITRLIQELNLNQPFIPLKVRQNISGVLSKNNYSLAVTYTDNKIISVTAITNKYAHYSVAIDIGTTTVVLYLLNSTTGAIVESVSQLNSQKSFGADVISRIDYCIKNSNGLKTLGEKITTQLDGMIRELMFKNNINESDITSLVIAGNTTMLHLLTGTDPATIATAPFTPVFLDSFSFNINEIMNMQNDLEVFILPSISAYVGADIVSGVLATSMDESLNISLLVDLGTNGEIILGNSQSYFSCSTAAGPAFEGAHISNGIGAITGAINRFSISENQRFTTINNGKPIGICGSAIVDIVSEFITHKIIDETGRFDEDNLVDDKNYIADGEGAYIIVSAQDSGTGEQILFTQKDIREVQLAKASISAGIETLINRAGIERSDIKNLYIAGGFGNYININSASNMGLIPKDLVDISTSVGNSSGLGAIHCSLHSKNIEVCNKIVGKTTYIELSSSPYFQDKYIEGMMF
ncbi:MAG: ASKHA domain-containing protein [Spirochaetaceae bacterium]